MAMTPHRDAAAPQARLASPLAEPGSSGPAECPDRPRGQALDLSGDQFAAAILDRLRSDSGRFSGGYQGSIHLVEVEGRRYIVKTPHGRGVSGRMRLFMLRNEHRAYQSLNGFCGIPKCYGLVGDKHLVLEYLEGQNLRTAAIEDRDVFFLRLLEMIEELHEKGIAHGDLKKKDNVLVVDGGEPFIVDFGVAVVRRQGFHPINQLMFRMVRSWDLNAWVKRKHGTYDPKTVGDDQRYLRVTWLERLSRRFRKPWRAMIAFFGGAENGGP